MKKAIVFLFFLISYSSFSQTPLLKVIPLPKQIPFTNNNYLSSGSTTKPQAILTGFNSFGKIYALPLDKMPCFVTTINLLTPMPNFSTENMKNPYIPNPLKKEDIFSK